MPLGILYENMDVTKSFVLGKHCSVSFTHQPVVQMDMDTARKCADNLLRVLEQGGAPAVTHMHNEVILSGGFPPRMPDELKQKVKGFDVQRCNETFVKAMPPGTVRVERIATCMSSVLCVCVVDVEKLPGSVYPKPCFYFSLFLCTAPKKNSI